MAEATTNSNLAIHDGGAMPAATDGDGLTEQNLDAGEKSSSGLDALGNLDLLRQVILVLAVAICVSLIVMLFLWVKEPEMRPLGTYETDELIAVLDQLDQSGVTYDLNGNTIRVEASQYEQLKLNLARAGLNAPTNDGDDILLQDMGFGVSQRLEKERLKLSRERQIASAIERIRQVRKAQVMLALPQQSVFVRHNQDASATVFLTLRSGGTLGQQEVDSIVDMVATAVPGLEPTRVTVTDQNGRLLSSGTEDPMTSARRKEYELERKQEMALQEKIDAILIPILGMGNYTAQVDVTLDFSAVEETQKRFDPKTPSTRSEFTLEDYNSGNVVAGIPGALSNQPPADSAIPEDIEQMKDGQRTPEGSVHREATRNFELDTTIQHRRNQTGTVTRQTVSVALKEDAVKGADGKTTFTPIPQAELDKIRRLLEGSIGFSKARGDSIEVVSVPFASVEDLEPVATPIWEHQNFNDWVRWLAAALVIIVVILVLVRPAMRKLLYPNLNEKGGPMGSDGLATTSDGEEIGLIGSELDGSDNFDLSSALDLPNLHKDEDLLKAVRALVANEPDLSAQVIKNWVMEDGKSSR
ncbi:Flagellar M-ring protein [Vibrio stylophorae]|uniref:Flagellar M-ring protein n=1 Tax=Vibrio stylophorae TaxID=659351 RepID=A0ABN8DU57_9VIBR|nr:flagellar basal-body MS-ring/collar protein FliF [Vibrio stylophorae]CAH0534113.1 Flagellar M-ring protein [Vibrio stylophorae]